MGKVTLHIKIGFDTENHTNPTCEAKLDENISTDEARILYTYLLEYVDYFKNSIIDQQGRYLKHPVKEKKLND